MKKVYSSLLVILLIVAFSSVSFASGQFVGDRFGPKAHGMGGAFTAVADDASAIYWNPAGLVRSGTLGLQTNLGGSFTGLGNIELIEDFLDNPNEDIYNDLKGEDIGLYLDGMGAVNLRNFGLGVLFSNTFNAETETETIEIESESIPYEKLIASNKLLGEGIFSIGKELTDMPLNLGSLAVGANAKYLYGNFEQREYAPDEDAELNEDKLTINGSGYGVDLGALLRATNMINVGVNVRNAVTYYDWDREHEDLGNEFERRIRVGAAANLPFPVAATVAGDLDIPSDFDMEKMVYHLGVEKDIIFGLLSGRAGMYGQDDKQNYTAGLGINVPFIDVNIAADIINEIEDERYFSASGTFRF